MSDRQKVLVVDDDHDVVRGSGLRLRAAGYDTVTAYDGDCAIATAVAEHPDAILLDVRMPNKDGLTTLAELKQNDSTKHIPVVMLSASIVDQQAALEAGARFFIRKPYQAKSLLEAVETATNGVETRLGPGA